MSIKTRLKSIIKKNKFLYLVCKPLVSIYRGVKIRTQCKSFDEKYKIKCVNEKIGLHKTLNISDLYYSYVKNNELLRYDIIVRLLAIENYFGKNDYGFELYKKMQNRRIGDWYGVQAEQVFKELIASYETNGYERESEIILDKNLDLIDGSHRIALAIYYNLKNINACIVNFEDFSDYSIDFFYCNGFSNEEISLIYNKEKEVRELLVPHFSILIWSPAVPFKDEIIKDISPWGTVSEVKYFSYDKAGVFQNKVRAIYACDDIASWKVDKKIEYMKNYGNDFLFIDFILPNPCYRIKDASNLPISVTGERIKNILRTKYKERLSEYFYDILVHTSDNAWQADYINEVVNAKISVNEFLEMMNDYQYAITKTEVPYYPSDFPEDFPVGKDIDVICSEKDFGKIKGKLFALCNERYAKKYEVSITEEQFRFRIRIEKNGLLLLLQDDISYSSEYSKDFFADALSCRVKKDCYYILSPAYEYIVRMAEYNKSNEKVYHLDYLKEHFLDYDESLAIRYLGVKLTDILKDGNFERC